MSGFDPCQRLAALPLRVFLLFLSVLVVTPLFGEPFHAVTAVSVDLVVVPQGELWIEVDLGSPGDQLEPFAGALHGTLQNTPLGVRYVPSDDFWTVGSDVILFADPVNQRTKRVQLVTGTTADDEMVGTMPGHPWTFENPSTTVDWRTWQESSSPTNPLVSVAGTFLPESHLIRGLANDIAPLLTIDVDSASSGGAGSSTTVRMHAKLDDLDPKRLFDPQNPIFGTETAFYQIRKNGEPLLQLMVMLDSTEQFWIRMKSRVGNPSDYVVLPAGQSSLRIERFSGRPGGEGAVLYLDDVRVGRVEIEYPPGFDDHEVHELTMANETTSTQSLEFEIEGPTLLASQTVADMVEPMIFDDFTSGSPGPAWTQQVQPGAQSSTTQSLPGTGRMLDFDLDYTSPSSASFLEMDMSGLYSRQHRRAPGHSVRFWIDSSAVDLQPGTEITLSALCGASPWCGATKVRLRRTSAGVYDLYMSAVDDSGVSRAVPGQPVSLGPHFIEYRMRTATAHDTENGWIELWVDGQLLGRTAEIDNYDNLPTEVRFGVIDAHPTVTGVLSMDMVQVSIFD